MTMPTTTAEQDQLPPIELLHERWEPNPVPANIEVPGLDTSAPVQDQIEQIEQLITIKLQNIDANFARAHQILSTRILPAVKRYAVNTEPVREAARFWVSFYEQAAQVRIPTTEDFSTEREHQGTASDEEMEVEAEAEVEEEAEQPQEGQQPQPDMFDPDVTPAENSFAPENAAVSSTPMPQGSERIPPEGSEVHDAWAQSMQSPLKRLNEGLKSLREQEDSVIDQSKHNASVAQQSMQSTRSDASSTRRRVFTLPDKGKSKAPQTLLQNVLSKNAQGAEGEKPKPASPVKARKLPKKNPYVPPNIPRADWDGIVDLRTPRRAPGPSMDISSEEEDFPLPGMSPPRSAFGKRIAAQIGRTPKREAAARIGRDLVGDAERFQPRARFDAPSDNSVTGTMSTPSFSLFSKQAMGIDSYDRGTAPVQAHGSTSHTSSSDMPPSIEDIMQRFDTGRQPERGKHGKDLGSLDDALGRSMFPHLTALPDDGAVDPNEDDSFDDTFDEGYVPPAFPNVHQGHDESFGSDNSSDEFDGVQGGVPMQAFPINATPVDDSFDDSYDFDDRAARGEEDPTLFGMRQAQQFGGNAGHLQLHLQLHGRGVMDDTTALNSHLRRNVDPETPTPWVEGGHGDTL